VLDGPVGAAWSMPADRVDEPGDTDTGHATGMGTSKRRLFHGDRRSRLPPTLGEPGVTVPPIQRSAAGFSTALPGHSTEDPGNSRRLGRAPGPSPTSGTELTTRTAVRSADPDRGHIALDRGVHVRAERTPPPIPIGLSLITPIRGSHLPTRPRSHGAAL